MQLSLTCLCLFAFGQAATDSKLYKAGKNGEITLWRPGQNRYETLTTTFYHAGTCQPSCREQRVLKLPPDIPYKATVEVLQSDMQSQDELAEIVLSGVPVRCNPSPPSDFQCTFYTCATIPVSGVGNLGMQVDAKGEKVRDLCKCASGTEGGQADCYSAMLSGNHLTYGLVVRITLVPAVQFAWTMGPWSSCSAWECVLPQAQATRSVTCNVLSEFVKTPLKVEEPPDRRYCIRYSSSIRKDPPADTVFCSDLPVCQEQLPCKGSCFTLQQLGGDAFGMPLYWSMDSNDMLGLSRENVTDHSVLRFKLVSPGPLGHDHSIALDLCDVNWRVVYDVNYILRLDTIENTMKTPGKERATFGVARVAGSAYTLTAFNTSAFVTVRRNKFLRLKNVWEGENSTFSAKMDGKDCGLWSNPPPKASNSACRISAGWCCTGERCEPQGVETCNFNSSHCESPGIALLEEGQCEDIACSAIFNASQCEQAALAFNLGAEDKHHAKLIIDSNLPPHCLWIRSDQEGNPSTSGRLWYNARLVSMQVSNSLLDSTSYQLCQCEEHGGVHSYYWATSEWGECSYDCSDQVQRRRVSCWIKTLGPSTVSLQRPNEDCLRAGIVEPPSTRPCHTDVCYTSEKETKCSGEERPFGKFEEKPKGSLSVAEGHHCVWMPFLDLAEATQRCRGTCTRLGDCVGLNVHDKRADTNGPMCCFLSAITRWETNFRLAYCHVSNGVQTFQGCTCQVGWTHEAANGEKISCGPNSGGCCTTTETGAVPSCPTTAPNCGKKIYGQQHWDLCTHQGFTIITEETCGTNPRTAPLGCAATHSVSQCNQIATALDLPDTTPSKIVSDQMPSGCVWQTATSQLWLNQFLGSENSTKNNSIPGTPLSSNDFPELCPCPTQAFRWDPTPWSACSAVVASACGAPVRQRRVFCVKQGVRGVLGSGEIVEDVFCLRDLEEDKPPEQELCGPCVSEVVSIHTRFRPFTGSTWPGGKKPHEGIPLAARSPMAVAMGISEDRLRINVTHCCEGGVAHVALLLSDSWNASTQIDETLANLARLLQNTPTFSWLDADGKQQFMVDSDISVGGVFSWSVGQEWTDCDRLCGGEGVQKRDVHCIFRDFRHAPLVGDLFAEDGCDVLTAPERTRSCGTEDCEPCEQITLGPEYAIVYAGKLAPNGQSYIHESKAHIACSSGFESDDDVDLAATQCVNGNWTPLAVSCGQDCPQFTLDSWKYKVTGSGLHHGAMRQVRCGDRSASRAVEAPPSSAIICNDGQWSTLTLHCTGDCKEIEVTAAYLIFYPDGTSLQQGSGYVEHGATRKVACAPGFSVAGGKENATLTCNDGNWVDLDDLPVCKAGCPRYDLQKGYEIVLAMNESGSDPDHSTGIAPPEWFSDKGSKTKYTTHQNRLLSRVVSGPISVPGGNHGHHLPIQCAEGYNRVPGAIETVHCTDGQWSTLSLVCLQDCEPYNITNTRHAKIIPGAPMSTMGTLNLGGAATTNSRVPHGSAFEIGCRPGYTVIPGTKTEQTLTCNDGQWDDTELLCFKDCKPYVKGEQYDIVLFKDSHEGVDEYEEEVQEDDEDEEQEAEEAIRIQANSSVNGSLNGTETQDHDTLSKPKKKKDKLKRKKIGIKHGSQRFLVCAEGYSPSNETSDTFARGIAFQKIECEDGSWTKLKLQCFLDCPDLLGLGSNYSVLGDGLTTGSWRQVSCATDLEDDATVLLQCDEYGKWQIQLNAEGTVKKPLDGGNDFPIDCRIPLEKVKVETDIRTDDSSPTVVGLAIALAVCVSIIVVMVTRQCFGHRGNDANPPSSESLEQTYANATRHDSESSSVPMKGNTVVGVPHDPNKWSWSSTSPLRALGVWTGLCKDPALIKEKCAICVREASHMCFPCIHVCLCNSCAEVFNLRIFGGDTAVKCPKCDTLVNSIIDAKPSAVFGKPRNIGPVPTTFGAGSSTKYNIRDQV